MLWLDLEALDDANTWHAGRLDHALAPPPGGDDIGVMLSVGVFDSVLRDALHVAYRFTHTLVEVLGALGGTWLQLQRLLTLEVDLPCHSPLSTLRKKRNGRTKVEEKDNGKKDILPPFSLLKT
jgi:hypothetical protein